MKSYKFLSHVADVRLEVQADSMQELFQVALEGMAELIKKKACALQQDENITETIKEKMEISSVDSTTLLIDFLSEVLTYTQLNKAVFCKVKLKKLTLNFLSATIFGQKVDGFDEDIKAVTYHEAEIIKDENGKFKTIIIFDI